MKKIIYIFFIVMLLCGCNKKSVTNNYQKENIITKEDILGCYKKTKAMLINDVNIISTDFYDLNLEIKNDTIIASNLDIEQQYNYSINDNNLLLEINDESFMASQYKIVFYKSKNDDYNLILKSSINENYKSYSYFKKVEC